MAILKTILALPGRSATLEGMKRRARRVTIGAAVLGVGVIAILVVAHRGTVRDHVEAWRFQLARETETIEPEPAMRGVPKVLEASPSGLSFYTRAFFRGNLEGHPWYQASDFARILANHSGHYAIFATEENSTSQIILGAKFDGVTANIAKGILEANGWRIIEQRFPRRAYVVIRDENARRSHEGGGASGVLSSHACTGVDNGPMQEAAAAAYKEPWMRAISLPTPPEVPSRP